MKYENILSIALLAMFAQPCFPATPRTWTSAASDYNFAASVQGLHENLIDLKRGDGVVLRVPIEMLSAKDRGFVNQLKANQFSMERLGTISSPFEGYSWEKVTEQEVNGKIALIYVCSKLGSADRVLLTVTPLVAKESRVRVARLKGHYNGMHQKLQELGAQNLKGRKPKLTGAIPESVDYGVTGELNNQPFPIAGRTVFGKSRTFLFQAASSNPQRAQELLAVSETLLEQPQ